MTHLRVRKITQTSFFIVLCYLTTTMIKIPSPIAGYIHPGDAAVLLSAFLLGPGGGAVAAGLGTAMADVLSGYAVYAPGSLIIKALMAMAAGGIIRRAKPGEKIALTLAKASVAAEGIMIAGYCLYSAFVLGFGKAALIEIPGNVIQGAFGGVVSSLLYIALIKTPYVRAEFNK